jgi:small-conductance mechanosensitive channel
MLWSTLFKLIPWGQVIDHAPQVLDGAKKLYQRLKSEGQAEAEAGGTDIAVLPPEPEALAQAVREQRHALARLHDELEESGQLIKRLAEQNAAMVAQMESLRRRMRLLGWLGVLLAGGLTYALYHLPSA